MDAQRQYCEGCLRTIDEIRLWSRASDADKRAVWAAIEDRIAARRPAAAPDNALTPTVAP